MADELLDIVNEHDQVIGQQLRSVIYAEKMTNFRVVNLFVQNKAGQLWIPRRTENKRVFPLCLDASMGGHVAAGETYGDALKRELIEELRIDLDVSEYKDLGALTPKEHNVSAFMRVFLLYSDVVPDYNPDDFIEYFWLYPQEILAVLDSGDKGKSDLPKMIRYLFISSKN